MRTARERVQKGIEWLDRSESLKGWRSRLNPDTMQFANPDKGPLGQLFGDYVTGLNKLRIIGGGAEFGFRSAYNLHGDPKDLKLTWQCALITDKNWMNHNEHYMNKRIKGIFVGLTKEKDGDISITLIKGNDRQTLDGRYSSYDSAKRAVRKLSKTF